MKWKEDWDRAKRNLLGWWRREGLAMCVMAPRRTPREPLPKPQTPADVRDAWLDPVYRCDRAEHEMATTFFGGEAFPYFDTQIGPGSLGTFLGAQPHFDWTTVWYDPCIRDPDASGPIRFDPHGNRWWDAHMALVDEGLRRAGGRYLVGIPDLIENIDTLAAMRDNEPLLLDLVERPTWVEERLAEINAAFFAAFDLLHAKVRDADGGNAFSAFRIWGPGKTAKVQCDFSCMISPRMFRQFVQPHLAAQCEWLDFSLYHLDGTTALQHVEPLLEIEALDAIEWTPQAGKAGGGSPEWYDLYRRIRAGGKSVQVVGAAAEEVVPLLDAVGPEGVFVMTWAKDQDEAERVLEAAERYR